MARQKNVYFPKAMWHRSKQQYGFYFYQAATQMECRGTELGMHDKPGTHAVHMMSQLGI